MNELFNECIITLGKKNVTLMSLEETKHLFNLLKCIFPISHWGKINWKQVAKKITIDSYQDISKQILNLVKTKEQLVFVLWNNQSLPSIKTNLELVISHLDDILAVDFDTWVFSPDLCFVIEFDGDTIKAGINS